MIETDPWTWPEGAQVELQRERCVPKVLKLSSEVSECKPLPLAGVRHRRAERGLVGDAVLVRVPVCTARVPAIRASGFRPWECQTVMVALWYCVVVSWCLAGGWCQPGPANVLKWKRFSRYASMGCKLGRSGGAVGVGKCQQLRGFSRGPDSIIQVACL